MFHIHWVARQNKLEIPNDEEEVNTREIHQCDGQAQMWFIYLLWINKAKAKDKMWLEQRGKKTFSFLTEKKKGNKMQRVFLTMQGDPPHVAL